MNEAVEARAERFMLNFGVEERRLYLKHRILRHSGGCYGGICGAPNVEKVQYDKGKADSGNRYLNRVQKNSLFGSIRHAPLFAQIGLVMTLCFVAFQVIPIGFDLLFPLDADRGSDRDGKRWLGAFLSLLGWGSLGLLLAVILSV